MQNNVGLQTAYWSGTTPALDIHQIIELTKKANMDTIELKAGDFVPLTTEGRAALRKEIEDAGLSITINGTGLRPERDVSSSDEESHKAGIKHLCHMLDLSKEIILISSFIKGNTISLSFFSPSVSIRLEEELH